MKIKWDGKPPTLPATSIPMDVWCQVPDDRLGGLTMICRINGDDWEKSYMIDGQPWSPGTPLLLPPARCREAPSVFRLSTAEVCDTSSKPS